MSNEKKKIVFPVYDESLPFFNVGADISRNTLAYILKEKGYEVSCLGNYRGGTNSFVKGLAYCISYLNKWGISWAIKNKFELHYSYSGIDCIMTCRELFFELLEECIQQNDLVFVMNGRAAAMVSLAKQKQAVTVAFITDAVAERKTLYAAQPDFILYNSEAMAAFGTQFHQQKYHVVPSPFLPAQKVVFPISQRRCVTLINPIAMKGLQTFLELSKRFPNYVFQAIEGWRSVELARSYLNANVRYFPRQYDMAPIYQSTGILLYPSHYNEGFGRAIVEAGLYGVPSIVSSNGALPSVLGNGGLVVDTFEVDAWVAALQEIENNYIKYSRQAHENAQRFLIDCEAQLIQIGVL